MLDLAINHEAELKEKLRSTWFVDKYKYYNNDDTYQDIEVEKTTWDMHQFVSVNTQGDVIGFISYNICRRTNSCSQLGIVNFTSDATTFALDLKQTIHDIFMKFNFNKLTFSVVVGNPVERHYDNMVHRFGGRIVGVFQQDTKLCDGNLYDVKWYEVLREHYIDHLHRKSNNI